MGIAADFVLIVIAGLAGGMLARLLRLPTLVGYLLAGMAIGPFTPGFVGDTGNARGGAPHLHFEIHDADDTPMNPRPWLEQHGVYGY